MADLYNWDSIITELGPRLFRHFCVRFSDEQADDLTQECLIRLVQKVESGAFDSSRGNLRMYAFGIAHFIALENSKSVIELSSEDVESSIDAKTSLEDWMIQKSDVEFLRLKIKQLSTMEQQVIALMVDEELTFEEIAGILQCPIGTVKSHNHRAKQKLTELFKKEYSK